MVNTCAVHGCTQRSNRDSASFYRFPRAADRYKTPAKEAAKVRLNLWLNAIKRKDLTGSKLKYARVCSKHFFSGAPAPLSEVNNPDWVPQVNLGHSETTITNEVKDVGHFEDTVNHEKKMIEIPTVKRRRTNVVLCHIDQQMALLLNDTCRLCMVTYLPRTSLHYIFNVAPSDCPDCTREAKVSGASLGEKITLLTGQEVFRGEHMPQRVCCDCAAQLERYYVFQARCDAARNTARNRLQSLVEARREQILMMNASRSRMVYYTGNGPHQQSREENLSVSMQGQDNEMPQLSNVASDCNNIKLDICDTSWMNVSPSILSDPMPSLDPSIPTAEQDLLPSTKNSNKRTAALLEAGDDSVTMYDVGNESVPLDDNPNEISFDDENSETIVGHNSEMRFNNEQNTSANAKVSLDMLGFHFLATTSEENLTNVRQEESLEAIVVDEQVADKPHLEPGHFCRVCRVIYSTRAECNVHAATHTPTEIFAAKKCVCTLCPKRYYKETSLEKHVLNSHSAKRFVCHLCGKRYFHQKVLESHVATHGSVRSDEPIAVDEAD